MIEPGQRSNRITQNNRANHKKAFKHDTDEWKNTRNTCHIWSKNKQKRSCLSLGRLGLSLSITNEEGVRLSTRHRVLRRSFKLYIKPPQLFLSLRLLQVVNLNKKHQNLLARPPSGPLPLWVTQADSQSNTRNHVRSDRAAKQQVTSERGLYAQASHLLRHLPTFSWPWDFFEKRRGFLRKKQTYQTFSEGSLLGYLGFRGWFWLFFWGGGWSWLVDWLVVILRYFKFYS